MLTQKNEKNEKSYTCKFCYYSSCKKTDYNRHLMTPKHKKMVFFDISLTFVDNKNDLGEKNENLKICECSKVFKSRQGLYSHKKKCNFHELPNDNSNNQLSLNDIICKLLNDNKEMRSIIMKQQEQISELIPKVGNNNTINQKFNIQVFLNEKCKDAINMSDFIKSIEVSLQQLDYTKQHGLVNGLSNVIIEHMNKLGLYQRPIHCTDLKREALYIKEDDIWMKDVNKEKIKKAIKGASTKQFCALSKWTKDNPDFIKNDSKQDYYTHTLVAIANNKESNEDKIIKKLCLSSFVKE